jgi:uncharacterized protein YdhG (YjbR/CyaY superfamily)
MATCSFATNRKRNPLINTMAEQNKTSGVAEVNAYLAAVPADARAALEKLRETVKAVAPNAVEVISYQIPTFKLNGRMLVSYAAFKNHCSFFPGAAAIKAYEAELNAYQTAKGTVRFPANKPLPATLVRKLVKLRILENEARARKAER